MRAFIVALMLTGIVFACLQVAWALSAEEILRKLIKSALTNNRSEKAENISRQALLATDGPLVEEDEPAVVPLHVLKVGDREYLPPNLAGVQALANSFLSWRLIFVNVIDAFREVVNGVRYVITLNAIDSQDIGSNPKYVVCRLVILEKAWLLTSWGSKVRELQYTNCSSDSDDDQLHEYGGENYQLNPIFNSSIRGNSEITSDALHNIEQQIVTTEETTANDNNTFSEESATTTDSISLVLYPSNDEQKSEDAGFFADSRGADQFGDTIARDDSKQGDDSQAQTEVGQDDGKHHQRMKRSNTLDAAEAAEAAHYKSAEKRLMLALRKFANEEGGDRFKIAQIHNVTSQIMSGTLIKIDCDLIQVETEEEMRCHVELWLRPWLEDSNEGSKMTINCPGKYVSPKRRDGRSADSALEKKTHKKLFGQSYLNKTEHLFSKFQLKYKRKYNTEAERQMRFRIFQRNLQLIDQLNRYEMGSAKYGLTDFADLTSEEYRMRTGLLPMGARQHVNYNASIPELSTLPKEFDWRSRGVVTPVKNQGICGSCWAFSVTGNVEGLHALKTGLLQSYSEQELLDCDTSDKACMGGLPDTAFDVLSKIGGLELEMDYPYEGHKKHCKFSSNKVQVRLNGHVDLPKDELSMATWLIKNGPISIGINANAMQFYRGGVSHPWKVLCSPKNLDHGVLIVGYGVSEYPNFKKVLPYWIIKNSWGSKWGEQGYYRVYRGTNACGVSEMASSAILAD